ncbi:MAG: 4-hydroxythreonine-4-phosphate dehydrogenase PdxA [Prevotella sp.]|nr:4-hydroxythreonine-4-phosphate dehydrogenase PdxA [Prevotella sp.]
MEERKIRVAITQGDANGIGYEMIFRCFAEPAFLEVCTPIVYGSPKVAAYHRKALNLQANFSIITSANAAQSDKLNVLTAYENDVKVEMGTRTPESGAAARQALDRAIADFASGTFDALVTMPMDTADLDGASSQADYIIRALGLTDDCMQVFTSGSLRMAVTAPLCPAGAAAAFISKEAVEGKAKTLFNCLKRDFRVNNPRLAVLAYNMMASTEENDVIVPAVEQLKTDRVWTYGPFQADDFFCNCQHVHFDAILAMYHEQAMIPFKMLAGEEMAVFTTGLSLPLVEPMYIGGKEKDQVDELPLRSAIYMAVDAARNRVNYDEPMANPLKKLYHEKRDESEKVRFSIPKKHEEKN